jgi:hypothetical protein
MRIGYLEPYIGCFSIYVAATSISYSECVAVALVIQQAMRMRRNYVFVCDVSGCTTFLHIIS